MRSTSRSEHPSAQRSVPRRWAVRAGSQGIALAALVALAALTTSACGPRPAGASDAGSGAPDLGARVSLEEARAARRIVPASATAVDFVCALVAPERVAALPEQAFEYSNPEEANEAFDDHRRFARYEAEYLLALDADLVVADSIQAPETSQRLREAGVIVLTLPRIDDWPGARAALLELGEWLGASERAASLTEDLDRRVAELERSREGHPTWSTMSYSNFGGLGNTAGAGTTVDAMMRLAGLENLAATHGRDGHMRVTFEELIVFDPELFLVSEPLRRGSDEAGDPGGAAGRILRSEPSLAGLRAVRDEHIVALPAWLFATGSHQIVRGAEVLAERVDALLAGLEEEPR